MLIAKHAEELVLSLVQPLSPLEDMEMVDLQTAMGRILADAVTSTLDFPHWDNSAMDGYAVRFADVQECSVDHPAVLKVVEEIPAGQLPQRIIQVGQAARILTGSMLPRGADTVIAQEDVQRDGSQVLVSSAPKLGAFVRQRATFYKAGDVLLPAGLRLTASAIAVLAAAQCICVPVYRRPRVAILSTGNELVSPDQPLKPGQIVDSNQYALAALLRQAGAEPICLGVVPDQPEALKNSISHAIATADLVISSGGVSVGDYDYVDGTLAEMGAEIHIRAVAIKPGKPLTVATFSGYRTRTTNPPTTESNPESSSDLPSEPYRSVLYFGLPGNPVSALVTFWRFVLPALQKLAGQPKGWEPDFVTGRSPHTLTADGNRETYLWGQVTLVQGNYEFLLSAGSHSSGNLINLASANSLAVIPVGQTQISAGDRLQIMLSRMPAT